MRLISHPKGRIARLVQGGASDDQVMDDLFLVTLSRLPTADERKRVREHISSQTKAGKPRVEPLRDILWALLNTKAFYFYP